jgi:hypothetical protein
MQGFQPHSAPFFPKGMGLNRKLPKKDGTSLGNPVQTRLWKCESPSPQSSSSLVPRGERRRESLGALRHGVLPLRFKTLQATGSVSKRTGGLYERTDPPDGRTDTRSKRTDPPDGRTDTRSRRTDAPDERTDTRSRRTDAPDGRTDARSKRTDALDGPTDARSRRTDALANLTVASANRSDTLANLTTASANRSDTLAGPTDALDRVTVPLRMKPR